MNEIRFEIGVKTFNLNGAVEVSFNPTDTEFARRIYETFDSLDKKQDHFKEEVGKIAGTSKIFDFARERDAEMRTMIDNAFGVPVCDAVFGGINVYALADGLPVWCNLMLAVMDELDSGFAREQKATNARVAKYTAKYHK